MDAEHHPVDSHRTRRLADKMRSRKAYRDSYVSSHTRQFLARQMREFRGDMSQTEFGALIDKQQTVVSRLEDPNYGKWTLQTLFDVARKRDVAVFVRFVDFPTFLRLSRDMGAAAVHPAPYNQDAIDQIVRDEEVIEQRGALAAAMPQEQKPGSLALSVQPPPQSALSIQPPPQNDNPAGLSGKAA